MDNKTKISGPIGTKMSRDSCPECGDKGPHLTCFAFYTIILGIRCRNCGHKWSRDLILEKDTHKVAP